MLRLSAHLKNNTADNGQPRDVDCHGLELDRSQHLVSFHPPEREDRDWNVEFVVDTSIAAGQLERLRPDCSGQHQLHNIDSIQR